MTSFLDVYVKLAQAAPGLRPGLMTMLCQTQSIFAATALVLCLCSQLTAATPPAGFIEKPVATGLINPTAMTFAPDGRLFVCQQAGALRVIENDVLLPTPFMTLTVNASGERGLLGIAFDPNFKTNNFLYVYYTVATAPIHNRISRFTANGNVVVTGSELIILDLNNLSATNHNGGAIHFGTDGKLYAGVGENAFSPNAQSFGNLLGKILRINPDPQNLIPTDNPYFNDPNVTGVNKAIWSLGLRNPFTFAFQPGTSRMFINDVGQVTWEEINEGVAHSNYGWPTCEGQECSGTPPTDYRAPIYVYNHSTGTPTGCAIVGGAFYNPAGVQYPSTYVGKYFFADLCTGFIRYVDPNTGPPIPSSSPFATGLSSPVDLQISSNGSLYYLARGPGSGVVSKFVFPSNAEKNFDFDGDGKTDIAVWRPDQSNWYILRSSDNNFFFPQWGLSSDLLTPSDYDGDGKTDVAVWRPSDGRWYVRKSSDGALSVQQWGVSGDVPVPADYDGDSRADVAVLRPSSFTWYLQRTTGGFFAQQWGVSGDKLVPGDYNGDGTSDIAVWRPSDGFWYIRHSDGTFRFQQWGISEDKPVPGDYDNDGKIDLAVWRPSTGFWYVLRSSDSGLVATQWGESTDVPAAADYDGDGKTDIAIWRPSTGTFWISRSSDGAVVAQQWGGESFSDVPVPSVNAR